MPDEPILRTSSFGSSVSTGDITFNDVEIIGTGTIELVPNIDLYPGNQYLVIDPTTSGHIHIRAGGEPDLSEAILFLGGENAHVRISNNDGELGESRDHTVSIRTANSGDEILYEWVFNNDGRISTPIKTMKGFSNDYILSGSVLQLGVSTEETIITGPTPNADNPDAQRLIIQGQQGYQQGEGGDVYVWGGSGDADGITDPATEAAPGGDVKVRGGYAYGTGNAGYVNIEGGTAIGSGDGGFVNIRGGYANSSGIGGRVWIKGANSNSGTGGDVEIEAGTGTIAGVVKITNGEYSWDFDSDRRLNFPGYQNSQSFNKANGSLVLGDAETGVAWTGNEYISTAKVILQAEYDDGSSWRTHSCEVLVIRKKLSDTVNHIVYGGVYTNDPLFELSTDVVDGMTVLSIANLDGGYLHVSTFVTEIGTCS